MYPDSEQIREKLLADFHVYIMFDEFWGMNDFGLLYQSDEAEFETGTTRTPLQGRIDETVDESEELDRLTGNTAGREVIDQMVLFFDTPPKKKYRTLEEFIQFVLACAKFSINSSVDINAPKLQSFRRLVRHHISVANDLGSFEKEMKAFHAAKTLYMINAVQMAKELIDMPTYDPTLGITQAVQMQIETDIDQQIHRLMEEEDMTSAECKYIDAALFTMTGNLHASIVLSRYGSEKWRPE
ncbi:hypothetical protein ASPWEDRAFT_185188 [Aspergillus wentii DTO 134E9]|uniref:Uncharacterized protein n=1 Tax=Aspergillus wentii DTO 134E9 TaxID=1073089 RepID=A0A1L9RCR2_ASPWE|nr:uncharacterized protein ASPWEDRAFT_185188 [Aspergillus wentii DTO 134E9]OJJ32701.1 hypothetical protein ASPWEDRAFT_185188 [Aspergillus wentii DTO 134E9]